MAKMEVKTSLLDNMIGVGDMVLLEPLSEETFINNLKKRFDHNEIYVSTHRTSSVGFRLCVLWPRAGFSFLDSSFSSRSRVQRYLFKLSERVLCLLIRHVSNIGQSQVSMWCLWSADCAEYRWRCWRPCKAVGY